MRLVFLLLLALVGLAAGSNFLEEGKEYVYQEWGIQNAGTMDYSPSAAGISWRSKVRIQVAGNRLNVRVSDIEGSQFVGAYKTDHSDWKNNTYRGFPGGYDFSVEYSNGKVVGINVPASLNTAQRNTIRGAVANLQISLEGKPYFESQEKLLHGDCRVKYTVNDNLITRSVSHFGDCLNRKFRLIDNWRGWRCDGQYAMEASMFGNNFKEGRTDPEPIYSKSDSYYMVEKKGTRYQVNKMGTEAAIIAQPYQSQGVSHFIYTKRELLLLEVKASDGSIKPTGTVALTDLSYEFSDGAYTWNQDRDLKAREPLFTTGEIYEADQASLEGALTGILDEMVANFDIHDHSADNVERLHKYGLNLALPLLVSMDYAGLRSVFNRLRGDVSEAGVTKRNIFTEFIGSIGTTAAAIFIRDAINENLFDNGRDAARALTAIPFHIRRPNIQLVKEIESLMDTNTDKVVAMALPLTIGHLVRITCERAGKSAYSRDGQQCLSQFSDKYAKIYFDKFMGSNTYEEKVLAINVMQNIKWGAISDLLRPVVYGEVKGIDDDIQSRAVQAAIFSTFPKQNTAEYFLPVFMNMRNGPETRISALRVLSWGSVSLAHLSSIVTVLYAERDFEILNYAFTHFEKFANTINPCHAKKRELFGYFYKYMKQYGFHEQEYGLGISKTFFQEYQQEKYGYGGSSEVHVIGSPRSTTPLLLGVDIFSTMYQGYSSHLFGVYLRIEGLAKAIVRKFKKLPEAQWKLEDLASLLTKMGVQAKPDLPVRVEVLVWLKGTIVINRVYSEADTEEGGKISDFLRDLQGATAGNENIINHQRALMMGLTLYEQPTEAGSPMFLLNDLTIMASLKATIRRGLSRGVIFRDVNYDLHLNTQGTNMMAFIVVATKTRYEILQDRVYAAHMPRQFIVGINLMKKELRLQIKRPGFQDPFLILVHSRTTVAAKKMDLSGDPKVSSTCPTCSNSMIISKGNNFKKSRNIIEETNKDIGSTLKVGYFDCELDIARGNTVTGVAKAFSPDNKNPQTPFSIVTLGMRQARAFLLWFPKAEQCGAFFRWSQSETDPVHEIDITIQGKVDSNESKYFMEGKKILLKVRIELKGEPVNRDYKFQLKYEYGPAAIKNSVRAQFARQAAPSLGMPEYSVCFSANNQYPDFQDEFLSANLDAELKVSGDVTIKYGEGSSCADVTGEVQINFEHQTTDQAHKELKEVDYYKKCMEARRRPEWQSRLAGLPYVKECFQTAYDAALARKYSWDVQLMNLTPYVRSWITKTLTVVNAAMVPYWQMDSEAISTALGANEKFHVDLEYKNREQTMDMVMTNSKGKSTYNDVILQVPMRESLRALRFSSLVGRLIQGNILNPCMQTSRTVQSLDNATFPYQPDSCWSLLSAHCSPRPTFAVFTKQAPGQALLAKIHIGGHTVEFEPAGKGLKVKVNGGSFDVADGEEKDHLEGEETIFRMNKWGSVYTLYSHLNVVVSVDGTFVQVMPFPSVKGQHCGVCGDFDGNRKNDLMDKKGEPISAQDMAKAWCR